MTDEDCEISDGSGWIDGNLFDWDGSDKRDGDSGHVHGGCKRSSDGQRDEGRKSENGRDKRDGDSWHGHKRSSDGQRDEGRKSEKGRDRRYNGDKRYRRYDDDRRYNGDRKV